MMNIVDDVKGWWHRVFNPVSPFEESKIEVQTSPSGTAYVRVEDVLNNDDLRNQMIEAANTVLKAQNPPSE